MKNILEKYVYQTYYLIMNRVLINKNVQKQLKKIPAYVVAKLQKWADHVEKKGINEVRKITGYHDEPLQADRKGQRSIRLSKAYRAFYTEHNDKIVIEVIEVNKHEY